MLLLRLQDFLVIFDKIYSRSIYSKKGGGKNAEHNFVFNSELSSKKDMQSQGLGNTKDSASTCQSPISFSNKK